MRYGADPAREDRYRYPEWTVLRTSITEAILAGATPEDRDRLFPGAPPRRRHGGLGLAHGAAGVLYALATAGAGTVPGHVDWLIHATRRARNPHAGFYDGLHGVAYVLDYLGRCDEARTTLERAMEPAPGVFSPGLFGGLAGIGLNLLHFARIASEPSLHEAAIRVADRLAPSAGSGHPDPDPPERVGLMHGFCGAALFFIRLYEKTADEAFLDLAAAALSRDLAPRARSRLTAGPGHEEDRTPAALLATGSAGAGLVIHEYLRHRQDEELTSIQAGIRRACRMESVPRPGLFDGRAGLIAYLSRVTEAMPRSGRDPFLELHLRRLVPEALGRTSNAGGPGDRLPGGCADLATGAAGILLVLRMVWDRGAFLPFLSHRPPPEVAWGCGWWASAPHLYTEAVDRRRR